VDGFWLLGNLGMGCCWLMEWSLSAANTSTLWQGLFTCFKGCRVPKLLAYRNDFSFLLLLFPSAAVSTFFRVLCITKYPFSL
jgi:hypothetical protein